jgi:hypothetical protein
MRDLYRRRFYNGQLKDVDPPHSRRSSTTLQRDDVDSDADAAVAVSDPRI